MSDQVTKAQTFKALHVPGQPIILFNAWDPGSAKAVAASGAKALATSEIGDATVRVSPAASFHTVRIDIESLPTGMLKPSAGHNSIATARTVS